MPAYSVCYIGIIALNYGKFYNYDISLNILSFQTLMSVPEEHTHAVLMLCATIPRDRTIAHVNLDTLEMDIPAATVMFLSRYFYSSFLHLPFRKETRIFLAFRSGITFFMPYIYILYKKLR